MIAVSPLFIAFFMFAVFLLACGWALFRLSRRLGIEEPTYTQVSEREKAAVSAAINTLSEREKIVITLYYFEGRTLAEIGEVLGDTESRVSQIHMNAIELLREDLKERGAI